MSVRVAGTLAAVLGAVIVLAATSREWVRASGGGSVAVEVLATGTQVAPVVGGSALVCLAACGVALLGAPPLRRVAGVLVVLAAAAVGAVALATLADPAGAVRGDVQEATGTTSATVAATATLWPGIAVGAAVLTALGGAGLAVRPGGGRATSERAATAAAATGPRSRRDDALGAWDALSRGDDPTRDRDSAGRLDP